MQMACLIAKGYNQRLGVADFATFNLVIKPATIRLVLSIALINKWPIRQLDVNNVFLHDTFFEEGYMQQPHGFIDSTNHIMYAN